MIIRNYKVFEFGALALIAIFAIIFGLTISEDAGFCFIFGIIWGIVLYKILTAREHFMMNRFRHVLRQYASLDDPVGDHAREVLNEEKDR